VTDRRFWLALLGILALAAALRTLFPTADPPWNPTVGVVWHDEGAWVHNARNRALWGVWSTDAWNPLFIAPIFTGLEYLSFALFGVGLWQARLVSELAGFLTVVLIAGGVRRIAGAAAGLIAGAFVATNFFFVMYNRAALMESSMAAFIAAAWYAYVRAEERPWWAAAAGGCAVLAFFTKAAAAFFVAALAVNAVISWLHPQQDRRAARLRSIAAIAGLGAGFLIALAILVGPYWTEYRFYNWQMSVTRKPSYDLRSLMDRASWFPVLHDVFTQNWLLIVATTTSALAAMARWRKLGAGERLLVWWIGLGTLELFMHDVSERRFVMFIPAVAAMAAIAVGGRRALAGDELARVTRTRAILALPFVVYGCYVIAAAIARLFFLPDIHLGNMRATVRISAALALIGTGTVYAAWPYVRQRLARLRWSARAAVIFAMIVCATDLALYAQWAAGRSYENITASREIGRQLSAGTLVHGKLANGLSLENRIRPIFVGRNFGNYADRKQRDDVRYILTYLAPCVGYEGPVINDVIEAYPERRVIMTFDVAETRTGSDRAALVDKFGGRQPGGRPGDDLGRACD
jgi:4-amino-4-deoxy-L-arabinose transferase-like glycosyltransferase